MKKVVKFERTDGIKPTRTGDAQAFSFKSPIPVELKRGAKVRVDLGIKCSRPVQLFTPIGLDKRGIEIVDARIVDAGIPLIITLCSLGKDEWLEQSETLVRGIVLDNSDVREE